MARKNEYGLPDETLQLIAAGPDLINNPRYLQARQTFDSRMPGSELIKALRSYGTDNSGFTRYANDTAAGPTRPLAGRRGLFNPDRLGMKRIPRDPSLPGADTNKNIATATLSPFIFTDVVNRKKIEDLGTAATDTGTSPNISVGTPIIDDIVDDDVIDGTGGNNNGTGGTGTGGTGAGGGGAGGGTGTAGTGTVGTATTGTIGTTSTGNGDSLRNAIVAAMNGSGGSIDNSAAGLNSSNSASNVLGSTLTADQLAALTKPKVPNVTLEVSGNGLSLDDAGSKSQTYDYPEFLTPEELKAYEQWFKQSSGLPGAPGAGKPGIEETLGQLEI